MIHTMWYLQLLQTAGVPSWAGRLKTIHIVSCFDSGEEDKIKTPPSEGERVWSS